MASLFCLVLTIFWISVASGTEVYIPKLQGRPGGSLDVPIMIDQVDNLAGIKIVMKYDPKLLTFRKGAKTTQTNSLMHIINDKEPGRLIIVMAGARGIRGKDLPILNLTFDVKAGLKGNHVTTLEISELEMMSDQLKALQCTVKVNPLTLAPLKPLKKPMSINQ